MFDLRENDDSREVLNAVFGRVWRKYGDPFYATDIFSRECGWEAIDPLLGIVVKNLYDLFGEQNIAVPVCEHR